MGVCSSQRINLQEKAQDLADIGPKLYYNAL